MRPVGLLYRIAPDFAGTNTEWRVCNRKQAEDRVSEKLPECACSSGAIRVTIDFHE
jgi:hypothetical protein